MCWILKLTFGSTNLEDRVKYKHLFCYFLQTLTKNKKKEMEKENLSNPPYIGQ